MVSYVCLLFFFFQAEDGIRDAQESRGLGDVYKRQAIDTPCQPRNQAVIAGRAGVPLAPAPIWVTPYNVCLLYTSDAADDLLCVSPGGRRIIKKKKQQHQNLND